MEEELYFSKVLDASANTIWDELKKIRESSEKEKETIKRRWVWELIQNASDCTPNGKKIDIDIRYSGTEIIFSHNGTPFSYNDLLDLITQISSKQSSEDDKTGKFGTGFMSTHLLSEAVRIKGSFFLEKEKYRELDFIIDRSGIDYEDIKDSTKKMLKKLSDLGTQEDNSQEHYSNTKFIYSIEDQDTKEAVEQGIKDLEEAISYVLVFNENINSITFNNSCYSRGERKISEKNNKLSSIKINGNGFQTKEIFVLSENEVMLACTISRTKEGLAYFLPIPKDMAKIYCDFPLIGTEKFSFPIIINSKKFEVERDRNAIRDSNPINLSIAEKAVSLYKELINYCTKSKVLRNEFNICLISKSDTSAIENYCYNGVKNIIDFSEIIPIHGSEKKLSFKESENSVLVGIPEISKKQDEDTDLLWSCFSNYQCINIPTRETYVGWGKVFGYNVSYTWLNDCLKDNDVETLLTSLYNKDYINWLESFYELWIKEKGLDEVSKVAFVLNQKKVFVNFDTVNFDENIDGYLKEIIIELGEDIEKTLLHNEIQSFEAFFEKKLKRKKNNKTCANQIDTKVSNFLIKETIENEERAVATQQVFNKLTNWFILNTDMSKELFSNLYSKRMMLSSPEENLRRYKIAEKIEENNIKYEDLDDIIKNRDKIMDILNNNDLNQKDIIDQLKHIVTSSSEKKEYVDTLIKRSVDNVYQYLSDLKDYEVSVTSEKWKENSYSKTVFPAKYKGTEIRIVVRPSDYEQIIFYYDEELEALDDYEYQLWTDNGENQVMITLGDLLKTTGVTRIPLTKI